MSTKNIDPTLNSFLKAGWDGQDAKPINPIIISIVKMLFSRMPPGLKHPTIAPEIDGTLRLEWIKEEKKLIIDFTPDLSISFYAYLSPDQEIKETFPIDDFGTLFYILSTFKKLSKAK